MIASLPMYDWPEVRDATNAWWAGIARHLRSEGFSEAPDRLYRNGAYQRTGTSYSEQFCFDQAHEENYVQYVDIDVHAQVTVTQRSSQITTSPCPSRSEEIDTWSVAGVEAAGQEVFVFVLL